MTEQSVGNPMKNPEDWLTGDFADMVLDQAKLQSSRNWLIILLLITTGRRVGELIQLKVKDINWDNAMILWNIEKKHKRLKDKSGSFLFRIDNKGKKRHLTEKIYLRKWKAIDSKSLSFLRNYILEEQLGPEDYVFYSPYKGKNWPISRNMVWIFVNKIGKKLSIKLHPHTLRHTFSVWVAQNMKSPADLKKLKDLLEHSDTKVTETYLQFSPKETKDLLERTFNIEGEE